MENCEQCGTQLEVPLVLRTPGQQPQEFGRRSGEELCAEHFQNELAQLGR